MLKTLTDTKLINCSVYQVLFFKIIFTMQYSLLAHSVYIFKIIFTMQYSLLAHSVYINFDQSDFKAEIIHLYSLNKIES